MDDRDNGTPFGTDCDTFQCLEPCFRNVSSASSNKPRSYTIKYESIMDITSCFDSY